MNQTLFDCLQHYTVSQSKYCSSYITTLATIKLLRKLNCIATRISKVTESRWVGQSPDSRCLIPSRPKNSSRRDGEPETMLGLAGFCRFLDEPWPTQPLWQDREVTSSVQWDVTLWAVTLRTVLLTLKSKRKSCVGHIHRTVFRTTVQPYAQTTHTHTHTATQKQGDAVQWDKAD